MPLLAELEVRILLGVLHRADDAVATAVHAEIEKRTRQRTSLGSVYITLDRLEKKGLLRSRLGDPTPERGGRAKRYYALTPAGRHRLKHECLATQRMLAGLNLVREE